MVPRTVNGTGHTGPTFHILKNAWSFNQPLNNWNVSNVEDMRYVFDFPSSFDQRRHAPWYVPTEEEEEE